MTETWHQTFREMNHEDRVMTIVEDGSTADALLDEHDALVVAAQAVVAAAPGWGRVVETSGVIKRLRDLLDVG